VSATALQALGDAVRAAAAARNPLRIRAGGSKDFYGNTPRGEVLEVQGYTGIVSYEPNEMVVTARCGTPLAELEAALAERGQMLGFEPPDHDGRATVGGVVAAGLAGPARMAAGFRHGGVRDAVLGAVLLDGRAQMLRFGGTVLKNVAGYDVSRLLAGSLGALGLIAEVSLKVLPLPALEASLQFEVDAGSGLRMCNRWRGQPLPVTATSWYAGYLRVRLGGARAAVQAARAQLGGEELDPEAAREWWLGLRHHRHEFFRSSQPLWRMSLPANALPLELAGPQLLEWNGMQRWLQTSLDAAAVRAHATALGGHATLYRRAANLPVAAAASAFTPLPPELLALHQRLRAVFDPDHIFDFGRLVAAG
jgi:glycolate oxidase FAD binding subunit